MKIDILLFAGLKQACGTSKVSITVSEPATVSNILDELKKEHNTLKDIPIILCAKNLEYVTFEEQVQESDSIAFFTPVNGG